MHVASLFRKLWLDSHFGVAGVLSEDVKLDLCLGLLTWFCVHVEAENVTRNGLINFVFSNISHDENGVESGQYRTLKVNLFSGMLQIVISTKDWVSGGKNR